MYTFNVHKTNKNLNSLLAILKKGCEINWCDQTQLHNWKWVKKKTGKMHVRDLCCINALKNYRHLMMLVVVVAWNCLLSF